MHGDISSTGSMQSYDTESPSLKNIISLMHRNTDRWIRELSTCRTESPYSNESVNRLSSVTLVSQSASGHQRWPVGQVNGMFWLLTTTHHRQCRSVSSITIQPCHFGVVSGGQQSKHKHPETTNNKQSQWKSKTKLGRSLRMKYHWISRYHYEYNK